MNTIAIIVTVVCVAGYVLYRFFKGSYVIGQPKEYPHEIVKALVAFYQVTPNVRYAHLGQIWRKDSNNIPAHIIIGVELDRDDQAVIDESFRIVEQIIGKGTPIEIMIMHHDSISSYFRTETLPFYKRSK